MTGILHYPKGARVRHPGRSATVCLAALALVGLWAAPATAQSIDYGALEQLFGESVTTSVTGSPQRVSDVPATMEIVTQDDIRRSGARDIPGVLRHVVGIDVLQWTNDQADVAVRGYDQSSSSRLLVLIDGRQVYGDYYGFTPWSALPVELGAIRQIEIVKGPNSALFGFNAVGGVINVVTFNPLYDDVNTVSLSGGTQRLAEGSAVTSFKLGGTAGFRLSAGGGSNDDFSTPIPPVSAQSPRQGDNHGRVDLDGIFRLGSGVELGFEASHSQADQNGFNSGYFFDYFRYRTDSLKGQISAETRFGQIQATAYTNWNWQDDIPGVFNQRLRFSNQLTVLQVQDIFKLGSDHTLRATAEYRHDVNGTTPLGGADVSYDIIAAGGMWEWKIAPTLSLTNALRLDHLQLGRDGLAPPAPLSNADWDRGYAEPSFNSGLVWNIGELDTLRVTASRGVQTPSLVNIGAFLQVVPGAAFTGAPTLSPTIVTNYELGWDRSLPSIESQFRGAAFHQRSTDLLSVGGGVIPSPSVPIFIPANVGNSEADGLELELKGSLPQSWRWGLSYRAEIVTDDFLPFAQRGAFFIDFQHATPVHMVKGNLGWSHGPWEIDGYLQYQSKTFGLIPSGSVSTPTRLTPIADYVSVDGRVAYSVTDRATLSLSGQNIAQSPQQQTAGPKVERRIFGTLTIGF